MTRTVQVEVYPRVCGGTNDASNAADLAEGLSPRVRGNHNGITFRDVNLRSIPACAGEPPPNRDDFIQDEVYPRVCGGTVRQAVIAVTVEGLSPRVRGNLKNSLWGNSALWSIPACAGEPHSAGAKSSYCTVYPRVCGGTPISTVRLTSANGLSPRVRGNHSSGAVIVSRRRSIPACAGEPSQCTLEPCWH